MIQMYPTDKNQIKEGKRKIENVCEKFQRQTAFFVVVACIERSILYSSMNVNFSFYLLNNYY